MSQESKWLDKEGDSWFDRSKNNLEKIERFDWCDYLIGMLDDKSNLNSFLELGCSNGWRLEKLRQTFPEADLVGVDASSKAIESGKSIFPKVDLRVGPISEPPVEKAADVVIVMGVLCYLDRSLLSKTVFEIDKLVKDGGYLLIGDFLPGFPVKREFSHDPSQKIFKLDYSQAFTSLGTYSEVAKINFNADKEINLSLEKCGNNERFACVLLNKSLDDYYELIP